MPEDKDFKRLVRARMGKTGEAYTTARAHLRPGDDHRPDRLRGRHPDTAALARLLATIGVGDPVTGRALTEAMALGISGGIGFAYFVFEYEDLTTLYLGGRINPYVLKRDATEVALTRLGVPAVADRLTAAIEAELAVVGDQAEIVNGQAVSGGYYAGLRVQPSLGRAINDEDDKPGSAPVVVLPE